MRCLRAYTQKVCISMLSALSINIFRAQGCLAIDEFKSQHKYMRFFLPERPKSFSLQALTGSYRAVNQTGQPYCSYFFGNLNSGNTQYLYQLMGVFSHKIFRKGRVKHGRTEQAYRGDYFHSPSMVAYIILCI